MNVHPRSSFGAAVRHAIAIAALGAAGLAGAQAGGAAVTPKAGDRTLNEWLVRMHDASRHRNYTGTLVVSSNTGAMSSARIWHACDAEQQVDRLETLTGAPRSTVRRNDEVVTFLHDSRVVRTEKRESTGMFPDVLKSGSNALPDFYSARRVGSDRVAGFEADVVHVAPRDGLRFGYRIWSEKKSGLVVKLQTLGTEGDVLEQAAFSELQLDVPLKPERIAEGMAAPDGWRVEKTDTIKTTAASEGWALKGSVPGFLPMSCYKRRAAGGAPAPEGTMQWIFSDGLASVSLFVEPYDRQRHVQEGLFAAGATQTFTRRIQEWWLTAVGEVPSQTLKTFALGLERRK